MFNKLQQFFKFQKKSPNYYKLLGETEGISILVENFYHIMETDPKAVDCLNVHEVLNGKIPDSVKLKLKEFVSGWLGGPNLFVEKHGAPKMRMRHMHIKISEKERDQWLYCMNNALKIHTYKLKTKQKISLANSFAALAYRIQNL